MIGSARATLASANAAHEARHSPASQQPAVTLNVSVLLASRRGTRRDSNTQQTFSDPRLQATMIDTEPGAANTSRRPSLPSARAPSSRGLRVVTSDIESTCDSLLREAVELRVPSSPLPLPAPGELLQDKYRIVEKLDKGGMGAVFHAIHVESGKPVAIKWLLGGSQQAERRFLREARIAAQVDHPNVVNVFDVGSHRGGRFLVMELLRGESLGTRIRRARVSAQELVAIMVPVLRGVAAAHRAGVVHRDLKPDNVFLCIGTDGCQREPKVLDFGISKLRSAPALEDRLTAQGTGLGTIAYMSPEQLVDALDVDERTDIYAVGAMMYEALTGRLPFRADSYNALVLAIAAQRPLPIRTLIDDVPPALEEIVLRAMSKDAAKRQQDVPTLIAELEACCGSAANSLENPHGVGARKRMPRWSVALWASAPVLIALWFAAHPPQAPRSIASIPAKKALASVHVAAPQLVGETIRSKDATSQPTQPEALAEPNATHRPPKRGSGKSRPKTVFSPAGEIHRSHY